MTNDEMKRLADTLSYFLLPDTRTVDPEEWTENVVDELIGSDQFLAATTTLTDDERDAVRGALRTNLIYRLGGL